jgi:transcriptional regulator with XRE-family HTH domain
MGGDVDQAFAEDGVVLDAIALAAKQTSFITAYLYWIAHCSSLLNRPDSRRKGRSCGNTTRRNFLSQSSLNHLVILITIALNAARRAIQTPKMRSANEKKEFSQRLKQAMGNSRKRITGPSELADAFNLNHHGTSVSPQAAYKWLNGTSIPTMDKVQTLAEMFKVPVQWLRLGIPGPAKAQPKPGSRDSGRQFTPTSDELQILLRLRQMPSHRRHLLVALVADLSLDHEAWRE